MHLVNYLALIALIKWLLLRVKQEKQNFLMMKSSHPYFFKAKELKIEQLTKIFKLNNL